VNSVILTTKPVVNDYLVEGMKDNGKRTSEMSRQTPVCPLCAGDDETETHTQEYISLPTTSTLPLTLHVVLSEVDRGRDTPPANRE